MKKGILIGIMWSFLSWIPYYTNFMSGIRNIFGLPATIGLLIELNTGYGDGFIYSIFAGAIIGGLASTAIISYKKGIKIIGIKNKKAYRRYR